MTTKKFMKRTYDHKTMTYSYPDGSGTLPVEARIEAETLADSRGGRINVLHLIGIKKKYTPN